MKSLHIVLAALALTIGSAVPLPAQATVLFESGGYSNISNPATNAWCSSCGGTYKVYDQFTLGSSSTITSTNFAIQSNYGSNWNILLQVWSSDRSSNLFSETLPSGSYTLAYAGNNVDLVSANLTGLSLSAGDYWMSWYDPIDMGVPGYSFPGGQLYQDGQGTHLNQVAAFQLINSVPEPATIALFGVGLLGLGFSRRRKRA